MLLVSAKSERVLESLTLRGQSSLVINKNIYFVKAHVENFLAKFNNHKYFFFSKIEIFERNLLAFSHTILRNKN